MSLFLFHRLPSRSYVSSYPFPVLRCLSKPISLSIRRKPVTAIIPARDRIIDFGKYKGKMLGTLPSKYLKWVSKNLRARDFEEWAKLADEVLEDPFYRDRLEWEFADKILNGDDSSRGSRTESPVSDLLEISERFGWDNEDKFAWSRIDFALLGTSKGGRIPRNREYKDEEEKDLGFNSERKMGFTSGGSRVSHIEQMGSFKKDLGLRSKTKTGFLSGDSRVSKNKETGVAFTKNSNSHGEKRLGFPGKEYRVSDAENKVFKEQRKVGYLSKGFRVSVEAEERYFEGESHLTVRREERRERRRLKRGQQMNKLRLEIGGKNEDRDDDKEEEFRFQRNGNQDLDQTETVDNYNPFPGREALLKKVLNNRTGV